MDVRLKQNMFTIYSVDVKIPNEHAEEQWDKAIEIEPKQTLNIAPECTTNAVTIVTLMWHMHSTIWKFRTVSYGNDNGIWSSYAFWSF